MTDQYQSRSATEDAREREIWAGLTEELEAETLKTGEFPPAFRELMMLSDHDSEDGRIFQNYMEQLTHRMLPNWDFKAYPIRFLISDTDDINAGVIAAYKPALMFFNKGLLQVIGDNENMLMHVLGHELGHELLRQKIGHVGITKPEEILVNMPQIQWMYEAGYDPRSSIEFAQIVAEKSSPAHNGIDIMDMAIALGDEHLTPAFDIDVLNNTIVAYRNQVAGHFEDTKVAHIPQEMKNIFERSHHISHVQRRLNEMDTPFDDMEWQDQLSFIHDEIKQVSNGWQTNRAEDLLAQMHSVENDIDEISQKIAHDMVASMEGEPDVFRILYGTINANLMNQGPRVPTGPLVEINTQILAVSGATSQADFLASTHAFIAEVEKQKKHPLETLTWSASYQLPSDQEIKFATHNSEDIGVPVPWNQHVQWAIEALNNKDELPAIALAKLGVEDPRLYQAMPHDLLQRVLEGISDEDRMEAKFAKGGDAFSASNEINRITTPNHEVEGRGMHIKNNMLFIYNETRFERKWNARQTIRSIKDRRDALVLNERITKQEATYMFDGQLPFSDNTGFENWFDKNKDAFLPPNLLTGAAPEIRNFQSILQVFFREDQEDQSKHIAQYKDSIARGVTAGNARYDPNFLRNLIEKIEPFELQAEHIAVMFKAQIEANGEEGRQLVRNFFLNPVEEPGFRQLMESADRGAFLSLNNAYVRFLSENKGIFSIEEKASIFSQHVLLSEDPAWWNELLECEPVRDLDTLMNFINASQRYSGNVRDLGRKQPVLTTQLSSQAEQNDFFTLIAKPYAQVIFGYNYLNNVDPTSVIENAPDIMKTILASELQDAQDIEQQFNSFFKNILETFLVEDTKQAFADWFIENKNSDEVESDLQDRIADGEVITELERTNAYKDKLEFPLFLEEDFWNRYVLDNGREVSMPDVPIDDTNSIREILRKHVEAKGEWPQEIARRANIYKNIDSLDLFPNYEYQAEYRDLLLKEIKEESNLEIKLAVLKEIIGGDPVKDPVMRQKASILWTETLRDKQQAASLGKDGLDNGDLAYRDILEPELEWAEAHVAVAERYNLFVKLADALETQRDLSYRLGDSFMVSGDDLDKSDNYFRGAEAFFIYAVQKPEGRQKFLDYIMTDSEDTAHKEFGEWILEQRKTVSIYDDEKRASEFAEAIDLTNDPEYYIMQAQNIYSNFWQAPLPARIAIMDQLLMTPEEKVYSSNPLSAKEQMKSDDAYERAFTYVVDRLLPEDIDYAKESRIALEVYKSSLPVNERALFLSAMLAASDATKKAGDNFSAGERLAVVLEMLGPAHIKFGQGLSNYPDAPMDLRKPMVRLTKNAARSPRWKIWKRYDDVIPEEYRNTIERMGPVMAAASYNEAIELEKKDLPSSVLTLQRPHVERLADAGFKQLRKFVQGLRDQESSIESHVAEASDAILEQAQGMAEKETDATYRVQQVACAQKYYNGLKITVDGHEFEFKTARWLAYGVDREEVEHRTDRKEWCDQEKIEGVHFDELPEGQYKKSVAKAVVTAEFSILLSGQPIDHDVHAAQMKINKNSNQIGRFDNGGLDLDVPTQSEKQDLAKALASITKNYDSDLSIPDIFYQELQKIKAERGEIPDYLVKVERGVLAMTPFFEQLGQNDLKNIVDCLYQEKLIDQDILNTKIELPIIGKIKLSTAFKKVAKKGHGIQISQLPFVELPEPVRFDYKGNNITAHPVFRGVKASEPSNDNDSDEGVSLRLHVAPLSITAVNYG